MKKVFITGGSGFIGKNIVEMLTAKGFKISALCISGADADIVAATGAEPVMGTLDQPDILADGIRGCELVIHLAAIMETESDYNRLHHVNCEGTRTLVTVSKDMGVSRFIHISAAAVLTGGKPIIKADETWPIPPRPVGAYARTKALGEKIVLRHNSDGFRTIVMRPPCIWGAGDQAMLPAFIKVVKEGKFKWIDNGNYPYSSCHVKNVCEGIILAAEKGRGGEVYFLTDGPAMQFKDFFTKLLKTQGCHPGDKSLPRWVSAIMAPALEKIWKMLRLKSELPISREKMALFFNPLWVNDDKARRELGYRGRISLEEGLRELSNR